VNLIDWAFVLIQMIIFYVAFDQCGTGALPPLSRLFPLEPND